MVIWGSTLSIKDIYIYYIYIFIFLSNLGSRKQLALAAFFSLSDSKMSDLDSVAVFRARMGTLRIGDLWEKFEGLGWSSMGTFAFAASVNFGGGQVDEAMFSERIITPLFGVDGQPPLERDPREASVRRLHVEAYTITVADLQRRAGRTSEDEKPKSMAQPERAARLMEVTAASGLLIQEVLEPSDVLIDKLTHMQEVTNRLLYIPLEEIGKRDDETRGIKKDSFWKTDSSGTLKLQEVGCDAGADISSDLKLYQTLVRRGIAFHMAHLLSTKVHDELKEWYIRELQRDAVPGYQKISLTQVLRVDQEIFRRLAELTRSGLATDMMTGDFVLDPLLPRVLLEPRIVAFMNPLPLGAKTGGEAAGAKRGNDNEVERLREEVKRMKTQLKAGGKGAGKGSGKKDKDKDKDKKRKPEDNARMPKELIGLPARIDGVRACFDYNLKGCNKPMDGNGACDNGKHGCLRCGSTGHGASQAGAKS